MLKMLNLILKKKMKKGGERELGEEENEQASCSGYVNNRQQKPGQRL